MPIQKNKKIIIIGGGPTGIGAAYHLNKLGYDHWTLFEKNDHVGGICSTHLDEKGFRWDEGGHVLFSHFAYFDKFVSESLGKHFHTHQRECWIKFQDVWVPYPFQNNIRHLPPETQLASIQGLIEAQRDKHSTPKNFKEWIMSSFGRGIADAFMLPYNTKVWATSPERMAYHWIGERVSVVDVNRILGNIIHQRDDVTWGPNNTFIYPKSGGTQSIYESVVRTLKEHIQFNKKVTGVRFKNKTITFSDGTSSTYDYLINTAPINDLVTHSDAPASIKKHAASLAFNSVMVIGLGLRKKLNTSKYWVYFPDLKDPFFRFTFFSNYSPSLVPNENIDMYSSFMCEVSYSKSKKINKQTILDQAIAALVSHGILDARDRKSIISKYMLDIQYAYPIPTLNRNIALKNIQAYLLGCGVFSRGRFGAWKYEIGNMDHSFMQGVEAVDAILKNKKETIWSL